MFLTIEVITNVQEKNPLSPDQLVYLGNNKSVL